jgi:hypothetical protein
LEAALPGNLEDTTTKLSGALRLRFGPLKLELAQPQGD